MKRKIQVSVRDLAGYSLRSGDLAMDFSFGGGSRALDGIRAHQEVQESRPEEYRPEVTISHLVETEDLLVVIAGRIDGIYRYHNPESAVIDEIKTTTRALEGLENEQNPIHWGQVNVYAYIYALQQGLDEVEVQLTYYHLETKEVLELRESCTRKELEVFFNELLDRYLGWLHTLEQWRIERDESCRELKFPFDSYRPGQRHMALEVYRAIENREQLIVEAPTGIGKTMAVLFPAVKAIGSGLAEMCFYLTAKTTGRTVAQKALADLRQTGLKFKAVTLTAKDKICFEPESECSGEQCAFARGYYDRINGAVEALFTGAQAITRDVIEAAAREFSVCPFEFSLELSLWADAVICDYNYAFDPRVHLRRFFGDDEVQREFVFLVDEANNLVDRSREMFSAQLYKQAFLDLRRQVKKDLPGISRGLSGANTQWVKFKKEIEEAGQPFAQPEYPGELTPPLRRFVRAAEQWLAMNIPAPYRQDLMALYFEVSWFLKVAENYDSAYATCFEKVADDFRIKLFCIDPAQQLSEAFERSSSVVFFSATLSPMDYFRQVLGCDPGAKVMVLPSPFPPEHLCLAAADRISTLYKYRERTRDKVARIIDALVKGQPGNYLVFFPSYRYLEMVRDSFSGLNTGAGYDYLEQTPGMSEDERDAFLERFAVDNRIKGRTLVGFAVMGGIFGEGIDLAGDRLSGAAIVGVGLPGISLERELIRDYYSLLQDSGFEYAYLYPGMNRVFQAAGRVIRTAEERGVVVLIGHRFSTRKYANLFPVHWSPIRIQGDQHMGDVLGRFYNG